VETPPIGLVLQPRIAQFSYWHVCGR